MYYNHAQTNSNSLRSLALLLATTAMLSISNISSAHAQDTVAPVVKQQATDENEAQLDEIIVMARKVSERVQDIPISVTVASAALLTQQNVQLGSALDKITPSLKMNALTDGPSSPTIALRGQATSDSDPPRAS